MTRVGPSRPSRSFNDKKSDIHPLHHLVGQQHEVRCTGTICTFAVYMNATEEKRRTILRRLAHHQDASVRRPDHKSYDRVVRLVVQD
jgi:hypothetical protein